MSLRTISHGGAVQSTALVLLAMNGTIDFDVALFANVGDDSEHPATLKWVRETMVPLCEERGFPIHELRKTRRDGSVAPSLMETVRDHADPGTLREPFPIRGMNGAPLSRSCTRDWGRKIAALNSGPVGAGPEEAVAHLRRYARALGARDALGEALAAIQRRDLGGDE